MLPMLTTVSIYVANVKISQHVFVQVCLSVHSAEGNAGVLASMNCTMGMSNQCHVLKQVAAWHSRKTSLISKHRADVVADVSSICCASWSG